METRWDKLRNFSVVILTVIYLSGSGILPGSKNILPFQNTSANRHQSQYSRLVVSALYYGVTEPERSVSELTHCQVINFKNTFNSLDGIIKVTGFLFETRFFQYTKLSENFLVQYRKADIIFPFHYFW